MAFEKLSLINSEWNGVRHSLCKQRNRQNRDTYSKNINIHMYMYFIKKKYNNDMGFDVQINKTVFFFFYPSS